MIIDIHAHAYPAKIANKVKERMQRISGNTIENDASVQGLIESMQHAGIDVSVFLPVATNPRQVEKLNRQALRWMDEYGKKGLLSFAAVHPDMEPIKPIIRDMKNAGVKGIKIHPDYQDTYFDDVRYLRILEAAAEENMIILVHAGMDEVYPEHVHCDVQRILNVIQKLPYEKMIFAHMGGWHCWDDVKQYLCGAPVYFDTAFSLTGTVNVENKNGFGNMLDDSQFCELVHRHGVEKILFGSDSPWSDQKKNLEWIRGCSLEDTEKELILGENARKLLDISPKL